MILRVCAVAASLSVALADSALAFTWNIPAEPVPEFDGSMAIAALSLVISVCAVVFNRSRS